MSITAGIDLGSTYCKVVLFSGEREIIARAMAPTGFRLAHIARKVFDACLAEAGLTDDEIAYVVATGMGRHQVEFKDIAVTDLTAAAPDTRAVLDIGGQTMKASRLDEAGRVQAFRLNDKCAAGTGAFLEKTARYMGYGVEEISGVTQTSRSSVPISGVCAVFAESEVINHLSIGTPPGDIMQGAIESLTTRTVQLMRRIKAKPEYTLVGGIMRFSTMAETVERNLGQPVNVPPGDACQFVAALGGAVLGQQRLAKLSGQHATAAQVSA